eukprot:scpid105956/ scgid3070/ 
MYPHNKEKGPRLRVFYPVFALNSCVILHYSLCCIFQIADFYRVAQLCPHKKKTNSNETSSQLDCVPTNKDKMLYSYKRFRNGSIGRSFAFTGVKLCTIILAIVAYGMRLGDVEYQDVVVALLTLCAYVYTTVFARDFKFSGPYLLSIYEIMTTIISRFIVIYLFSIMTFGLCECSSTMLSQCS